MIAQKIAVNAPHPTVAHYDLDVPFFQSFLDPYLKYTCGLFDKDHRDLDAAAQNMLDYLIDVGKVQASSRVLEIGSGWGSLIKRLRERELGHDYVGISPSGRQNSFIQSAIAPVPLIEGCFEDLSLEQLGRFDAIFLIGSFCHLSAKQEQLSRLRQLLNPGGRLVIEDSFFLSERLFRAHAQDPRTQYLQRDVFGYAEIPSLSAFTDMVRTAGMRVASLLDTTDDYDQTITVWLDRLSNSPSHFANLSHSFTKYLNIAQAGWNYTTSNYVAVLERLPSKKRAHDDLGSR